MGKTKTSLLDDVVANLPRKGQAPWHTTIAPELLAELEEIKARFLAGQIPAATKTGLATALSKSLKARGITVGHRGVESWLHGKG
jgi:hypothetical protein